MLICGANDVIGVGQYGYTAVYSGAGVLQAVFGYCSGTGTTGTGLQVLVLLVLSVYTAVLLATCIHLTSTWAAAVQLGHGAASEAGGRATGRLIVLTTHVKIP